MVPVKKTIGLIAGQGDLPVQIIERCLTEGCPIVAVAFDNHTSPETVRAIPHTWLKLGMIAPLFDFFRSQNVTHVVLAGGIKRPSLAELSLDWAGAKLLAKLGFNSLGDDGLLKALTRYIEEQGFQVIGTSELLPDLQAPRGCLTTVFPSDDDLQDIRLAQAILTKLGEADVGQALVIQQGLVLGVEAIEGTENLIGRVGPYRRQGRNPLLVKMSKPQQTLKADLPTIGPDTIKQCLQADFGGVAIEAGKTQILKQEETIRLANQGKIFVFGVYT
jgi:UDP-2,3-diacylglucosamine hydrolase